MGFQKENSKKWIQHHQKPLKRTYKIMKIGYLLVEIVVGLVPGNGLSQKGDRGVKKLEHHHFQII